MEAVYDETFDGAQAVPFQVWNMVPPPFQTVLAGGVVQANTRVFATQEDPFQV